MSGYRSVAFWLGLSASSGSQGGFRTPLPPFNAGGTVDAGQGGFRTPLPFWNAGATGEAAVDDTVYPVGTGEDAEARWRRIVIEDEIIMVLVSAFLQMKDR